MNFEKGLEDQNYNFWATSGSQNQNVSLKVVHIVRNYRN
jgi:hypothetical protein